MNTDMFEEIRKLSNEELIAKIQVLAQREREAVVALIAHLVVLDERSLYLAEGCSSLFTYYTQLLHLSGHAAYGRVEVAHAARKYPVILAMLADGSVNLTTVALLIPELTHSNHRGLLEAARHKSKREVQQLVATLRPQPPVPPTLRKLPNLPVPVQTVSPAASQSTQVDALMISSLAKSPARPVVIPLAPERYKVQFTASKEGYENLRLAQDLLRHQVPNGDVGKIVELALARLVKDLKKNKLGVDRPRAGRTNTSDSRHIPAEVKRKVWAGDGGRCAFVSHTGLRCTERGFLEFHHVVPYSAGGKATVANIELRCRSHNGYEADMYFGQVQTEPEVKTVYNLGL